MCSLGNCMIEVFSSNLESEETSKGLKAEEKSNDAPQNEDAPQTKDSLEESQNIGEVSDNQERVLKDDVVLDSPEPKEVVGRLVEAFTKKSNKDVDIGSLSNETHERLAGHGSAAQNASPILTPKTFARPAVTRVYVSKAIKGKSCEADAQIKGLTGDEDVPSSSLGNSHDLRDIQEEKRNEAEEKEIKAARVTPDRSKCVSALYKSPYLVSNVELDSDLTQTEKDIAEFVVFGSGDREVLFQAGKFWLNRRDLRTLFHGGLISFKVIDVWGHLLNLSEKNKDVSPPSKICMSSAISEICHGEVSVDEFDEFDIQLNEDLASSGIDISEVPLILFPMWNDECCPTLITINIGRSAKEVIHPMKKSFCLGGNLINELVMLSRGLRKTKKLPDAHRLQKFELTEPELPWKTLRQNDTGIYLMRHMEMYEGCLDKWDIGIKDNNVIVLKRLSVKYCTAILTNLANTEKAKVLKSAKEFRQNGGNQGKIPDHLIDARVIVKYVVDENKYSHELLVDTEWIQGLRCDLLTLRPCQWVGDTVINLIGIQIALRDKGTFFYPTFVTWLNPEIHSSFAPKDVKMHYLPGTANACRQIFLPIFTKYPNHWFLVVVDISLKKSFLLDSLPKRHYTGRLKLAKTVLKNLSTVLARKEQYAKFSEISQYPFEVPKVPRQENGYDCGLYVLKLMEAVNRESWINPSYFKDMDGYRNCILVQLVCWSKNHAKIEVLKKALMS